MKNETAAPVQTPEQKAGVDTTLVETLEAKDGFAIIPARFAVKSFGPNQTQFPFYTSKISSWEQVVKIHGGDETVALAGVEVALTEAKKSWAKEIVESRTSGSAVLTDIARKHQQAQILKYLNENSDNVMLAIPADMREEITRRKLTEYTNAIAAKDAEIEMLKKALAERKGK